MSKPLPPLRSFALSLSLLALTGAGLPAEQEKSPPPFYFGADYPIKPTEEVQRLFDESGLNCIRMTGGGYSWAGKKHKPQADGFQKQGNFVYLQLGSHYPSADYFPLKEAWLVDHAGETGVEDRKSWSIVYSGSHWPQYSYTTTRFRKKLERDFTAYLAPFQENTNAAGVILHNEPGYHWIKDRLFDYSAASIEKFRQWLAERHGSITTLNERWGTGHESFEGITPPGIPPVPKEEVAAWLDWRRFHVDAIADFLKWEAEYFKKLRPDLPRSTNLDGPVNNWYPYRLADIEAYSRAMDVVGIDIYPSEWTKRSFVPYAMDMAQGTARNRPVHVLECEVFSNKKWKYPEEDRARLLGSQLWTMIGHGADAILMWGFSRGDAFSLTNGEFNPRLRTVRDIAYTGKMLGGFERYQRLPSRVALVVDTDSYLLTAATSPEPLSATARLDMELQGYYVALRDAGYQVDVFLLNQVRAEGELSRYNAVFMPVTRLMDDALAKTLRQYVEGGGTLVAAGDFASADRYARPVEKAPGFGLGELFGEGVVEGTNPPVTKKSTGAGHACMVSEPAGAAYLQNGGNALDEMVRLLLKAQVPDVRYEGEGEVDLAALREETTGNVLIIATVHGTDAKLPQAVGDGSAILPATGPLSGPYSAAFRFSGSQVVPARLDHTQMGLTQPWWPAVDSAEAVLLVKTGAGPLLSVEPPAEITREAGTTIQVTVYNPSPQALKGELEFSMGNAPSVKAGPVEVAPQGSAVVPVAIKPADLPQTEERTPLKFAFKAAGDGLVVPAIPVDILVK